MATKQRKVHTFRGGEYVAALMAELSRAAIAQRIATARDQAGLNQPELADLMGVHWRTVQDWESPKKQATPWDRLDELANAMGVTKLWLLHGDHVLEVDGALLVQRLEALEGRVSALATRAEVIEGLETLRAAIDQLASRDRGEVHPSAAKTP